MQRLPGLTVFVMSLLTYGCAGIQSDTTIKGPNTSCWEEPAVKMGDALVCRGKGSRMKHIYPQRPISMKELRESCCR